MKEKITKKKKRWETEREEAGETRELAHEKQL